MSKWMNKAFFPFVLIWVILLIRARELNYFYSWKEFLIPFVCISIVLYSNLLLFQFIFDSQRKAALMISILLLMALFYNDLYFSLNTAQEIVIRQRNILTILFLALLLFFFILRKVELSDRGLRYLNSLSLLLLVFEIVHLTSTFSKGFEWENFMSLEEKSYRSPQILEKKNGPNFYFILADAYTSSSSLKEFYNYDNQWFEDSLNSRRFSVAEGARSNYDETLQSLASILNMEYLSSHDPSENNQLKEELFKAKINNNKVASYLEEKGYELKNYSFFKFAGKDPLYSFDYLAMPDNSSLLARLFNKSMFYWPFIYGRISNDERALIQIEQGLRESLSSSRAKFGYIHLPIPHLPYRYSSVEIKSAANKNKSLLPYAHQVEFTNNYLLELISLIQEKDSTAVIVVMGDHGSRETDCLDKTEEYSILFAVSDTSRHSTFPANLSAVNTFRLLFNRHFGANFELLPYKSR